MREILPGIEVVPENTRQHKEERMSVKTLQTSELTVMQTCVMGYAPFKANIKHVKK